MTKEEFIKEVEQEIRNGESLLQRFERIQSIGGVYGVEKYKEDERQGLTNDLQMWEDYVRQILNNYFGTTHSEIVESFSISTPNEWLNFRSFGMSRMNGNLTTLKSILKRLPLLDMAQTFVDEDEESVAHNEKPYKVFISHSSKDSKFVENLVDLLELIGIKGENMMFCSSVSGYTIPNSENIFDYLRRQFENSKLFVIFVHSANYYKSPCSLNEMGAAWVLRTDFCSLLVKGFNFEDMKGVINAEYASVKVDASEANARLNALKDKLISLFQLDSIDASRWEKKRDAFLDKVNNLPITSNCNIVQSEENEEEQAAFEAQYLSFCSTIFNFLDVKNYSKWMYYWACDGESRIYVSQYDNLGELVEFLNKFDYRKGFKGLNSLLKNMKLLLKEYLFVCGQHILNFDKNEYRIEKFYKKFYPEQSNPRDYHEYVFLIHDLSFELTRLLNLILERIRQYEPTFLGGYTLLTILDEDQEYVLYREEEKSDTPYPGLKQFVEETRFNRSKHLGTVKDINKLPISLPQCYT